MSRPVPIVLNQALTPPPNIPHDDGLKLLNHSTIWIWIYLSLYLSVCLSVSPCPFPHLTEECIKYPTQRTHHITDRTHYLTEGTQDITERKQYLWKSTQYLTKRTHYLIKRSHYLTGSIHYLPDATNYLTKGARYLTKRTNCLNESPHYLTERGHYQNERTQYSTGRTHYQSSVQFNWRWYLCARKSPYALHPSPRSFNSSNVRLTDDGPLSSFQGRSSSAPLFHASVLQAIGGVMSLALRPLVVSQAPQHFRSSEMQTTCGSSFACQSIS